MKKNAKQNLEVKEKTSNANKIFFQIEEDTITISKRKYESLIEELAYLRGKEKIVNEHFVTMTLEAYTELVLIKGRYDEIKERINKGININKI